jgi:hypothetical protein
MSKQNENNTTENRDGSSNSDVGAIVSVQWRETGRTHEECAECPVYKVMPPKCKGHPSGPVPCSEKHLFT